MHAPIWRCLPYACEYDPDLLGLDRDNLMEETRKLATQLGVSIRLGRGDFMANDSKDKSVLGHIDGLVKEESVSIRKENSRMMIGADLRR